MFSASSFKKKVKDCFSSLFFMLVPRIRGSIKNQAFGVNLIGYAQAEMGLGEILRSTAISLEKAEVPFVVRKLSIPLQNRQNNRSLVKYLSKKCRYPINCIGVNPDLAYRIPLWLSYFEWGTKYNVGFWFWELEGFPKQWKYACKLVDEVWVNTSFVQAAVASVHPIVHKIPFAVEFDEPSGSFDRAYFNLPSSKFLYIFSYDFNSSAARKNPKAVVQAFKQAFPDAAQDVGLVVKSINSEQAKEQRDRVKAELEADSRVFWIDEYLTTEEMRGLLRACDCYVSLHRSEGLGLGMAESMYLGKPVIATAYSGNMEYMNDENALLVPYQMVEVGAGEYLYGEGQFWAEADVSVAAGMMRDVFENSGLKASVGSKASAYMRANHSIAVAGEALRLRLADIKSRIS